MERACRCDKKVDVAKIRYRRRFPVCFLQCTILYPSNKSSPEEPVNSGRMETVMKKFAALFARKSINMNTEFARRRLEKSMPGEVGSMQSLRLTGVSL